MHTKGNLAAQDERTNRVPYFPMLKESTPRQSFFEHDEYLALLKALPSYLRPVVIFGYKTGWRKNESLNLKWDHIDLKESYIHLTPDQTKNSEARSIYVGDDLYDTLRL